MGTFLHAFYHKVIALNDSAGAHKVPMSGFDYMLDF